MTVDNPNDPPAKAQPTVIDEALRETILKKPDMVLNDSALMQALISANERAMGNNIVDLRGVAMDRLETRLERLEDTHRNVIAAAYENLAGTNQIHRAVLRLLEAKDFETFLKDLSGDVADILRIDALRLVLETAQAEDDPAIKRLGDVLSVAEPGFIDHYIAGDRGGNIRQVTLRQVKDASQHVYGDAHVWIASEACLKLDLGENRRPGMLVIGAEDPQLFGPQQGTDLLSFFTGVFERTMRRWLD